MDDVDDINILDVDVHPRSVASDGAVVVVVVVAFRLDDIVVDGDASLIGFDDVNACDDEDGIIFAGLLLLLMPTCLLSARCCWPSAVCDGNASGTPSARA